MSAVRALVKSAVESVLGARALLRSRLRVRRGMRMVLSYHNVIAGAAPLAHGDRSLHLPLESFRAQLDELARAGLSVVPLDTPMDPFGPPSVSLTFDDAYAGTLHVALPELTQRGLSSTIFVAPGLLGLDAPWWDRLASPALGAIEPQFREAALISLRGEGTRILAEATARGWTVYPAREAHRIATEEELATALHAHPLVTLGAHTWSHPNVAALDDATLGRELRESREWLHTRFPARTIEWLAYPYGLESAAARRATEAAGFRSALLVAGGWDRGGGDRFAVPRLNITPGISRAGFRARLAALIG